MTTITALFIPADTEAPTELRGHRRRRHACRAPGCCGGLVQPVHLARQRADMYVNEEGSCSPRR
ncbi:hypothetical protein QJS66_23630 (plasmid) [Kocuria rhizophila]|nr:hypothetical protein QJS66_23630 [Kocuria rhizophila]